MTEMGIAEVWSCPRCLQARVLLLPVKGRRGVILPVDYTVALSLKTRGSPTAAAASLLLADRLLSVFAVHGLTVQQIVLDVTAGATLIGKVCFGPPALRETSFCSPSEALMLAARARLPVVVTEATLRGPTGKGYTRLAAHHAGDEVGSHEQSDVERRCQCSCFRPC